MVKNSIYAVVQKKSFASFLYFQVLNYQNQTFGPRSKYTTNQRAIFPTQERCFHALLKNKKRKMRKRKWGWKSPLINRVDEWPTRPGQFPENL